MRGGLLEEGEDAGGGAEGGVVEEGYYVEGFVLGESISSCRYVFISVGAIRSGTF